jgi:hypothetical protein
METDTSYHDPTWRGVYEGMVMLSQTCDDTSFCENTVERIHTSLDPPVLESNTFPYALLTYDHISFTRSDCSALFAANKLPLPMLVTEQKTEIYHGCKDRLQSYMSPFLNQRTLGNTQQLCITNYDTENQDEPVMMYFDDTNST